MRCIAHACIGQNSEWFSILFVEIENLDRWDHRHESNQGWEIDFGQQTKQTRASRTKSMLQNHDAPMSVDMGVLNGRSRIKHEILSAAFWDTSIGLVNDVDQIRVENPNWTAKKKNSSAPARMFGPRKSRCVNFWSGRQSKPQVAFAHFGAGSVEPPLLANYSQMADWVGLLGCLIRRGIYCLNLNF